MQNLDYDIFEHNGFDDASKILEMFKRKNQRVMNIFPEDDTNSQLFDVSAFLLFILNEKLIFNLICREMLNLTA
jgi:hypothetical protein